MLLRSSVGEVQTHYVNPCREKLPDALRGAGSGAQGGDDLSPSGKLGDIRERFWYHHSDLPRPWKDLVIPVLLGILVVPCKISSRDLAGARLLRCQRGEELLKSEPWCNLLYLRPDGLAFRFALCTCVLLPEFPQLFFSMSPSAELTISLPQGRSLPVDDLSKTSPKDFAGMSRTEGRVGGSSVQEPGGGLGTPEPAGRRGGGKRTPGETPVPLVVPQGLVGAGRAYPGDRTGWLVRNPAGFDQELGLVVVSRGREVE